MAYTIDWSLIGPPAPRLVGDAIQRGFETGMVRSAFADLSADPTNESALSRLAMVDPQAGLAMRDRARQESFRAASRSAFDAGTGEVDPVAMRQAYVEAGDIEGAMGFERDRTRTAAAQQEAAREQLRVVADLLDDSTDQASYERNLAAARTLGLDVTSAPPQFDADWIGQQRRIVAALSDEQEMTTFMRDAQAAGIAPGSPQFAEAFRNRYAAPPRIMTDPATGALVIVGGGGAAPTDAPPVLTDDDFAEGGPSRDGSGGFPGD